MIRDLLVPRAAEAGIDFVISGHNHSYERLTRTRDGQTTHYVIVGGGGASLDSSDSSNWPVMDQTALLHHFGHVEIVGDTLRFEVRTTDRGKILDAVMVSHDG